jgi:glycosyltransferase involved in cell wall biosynthesis
MNRKTSRPCVLHLISSEGLFGAEMVSLVLAAELERCGLRPIIGVIENAYNPHTELIVEARARGLRSVSFPCRWQFDWSTVSLIRGFVKREGVDLIHCHGYKSNLFAILGAPRDLPKVTTNHNWLTNDWRLKLYCFLDSLWIRRFDRIIAVSDQIQSDMVGKGVPAGKISVVDNGVEIERFCPRTASDHLRDEIGLKRDDFVIGTVGNLNWEKGHAYLIDAAKHILKVCESAKFLIIGDGGLREALEQKVLGLGLKRQFVFTGIRGDIPELLGVMDIFVLPSVREGLPMALLEAMAAGKAIVSTKVGAIPRVLEDRVNGMLVEPMNSEALGSSVIELMMTDGLIDVMGKRARRKVADQYSSRSMADNYIRIYKELLEPDGG